MSKDLDYRLSLRETAAVQEWLDSNMIFHVMRDHPLHRMKVPAGMWGIKLHQKGVREIWNDSWTKVMKELMMSPNVTYCADQRLLAKYVLIYYKGIYKILAGIPCVARVIIICPH